MNWSVTRGYRENIAAGDAISAALPKNGGSSRKPKVVMMIDGAIDDSSSMIRFLIHSCNIDLQAVITTNVHFSTPRIVGARHDGSGEGQMPFPHEGLSTAQEVIA